MVYSKLQQTKKKVRSHRICKKCDRKRLIKFYQKPTSLICDECKARSRRVKKQSNIGKIKKEVETLAKKCAKKRDNYTCQRCDKEVKGMNAHGSHVIPVSGSQLLRFDLKNIKCLCYHCHMQWWHKNPLDAYEWFKKKFPSRYKYLQKKKHLSHTWTRIELSKLKKKYTKMLKD